MRQRDKSNISSSPSVETNFLDQRNDLVSERGRAGVNVHLEEILDQIDLNWIDRLGRLRILTEHEKTVETNLIGFKRDKFVFIRSASNNKTNLFVVARQTLSDELLVDQ